MPTTLPEGLAPLRHIDAARAALARSRTGGGADPRYNEALATLAACVLEDIEDAAREEEPEGFCYMDAEEAAPFLDHAIRELEDAYSSTVDAVENGDN